MTPAVSAFIGHPEEGEVVRAVREGPGFRN